MYKEGTYYSRHRDKLLKEFGYAKNICQWLKRQEFPEGYQTLCMNCQWIKRFENNETRLGNKK